MNKPNENHMNKADDNTELEKSKAHIVVEIIEYMPNAVVSKTIIKKSTGNITVSSFDAGEELAEKLSPFDNYIQIIDGTAELVMGGKKINLKLGDGIVIPAHTKHNFNANEQFKMLSTIIKSGYED
jgi:quercetin dioxygenase-like cupin family protein